MTARPPKILLPTELMVRCADSTEVIGNAFCRQGPQRPGTGTSLLAAGG